jgi:signal transduction histidine kinase
MHRVLTRVRANGQHLLTLINDVLDLSKIEAGQFSLSINEYSPREVLSGVCAAVESLASAKNLLLRIEADPHLPLGKGDERRIAQALLNLVGNAIKFTDAGEVTIRATTDAGLLTVSVSDTGPGIEVEHRERIFKEFQQIDSSLTRKTGGTGLGLPIAKRIVELHGGRIWVESAPGRGSRFAIEIPLRFDHRAEES